MSGSDNGQRDVAELEELTRRIKALARNTPDDTVLQTSLMAAATMLTKGAARALGRDLSPVGRRPSTAFKGSLSALRSMRTIRFIGAPFCEGQNLDGADLGPTALREAGLQPLAEMLGWSWEDAGDLDFAAEFERLGFEVSAPHHHPVELYREWVGDSGMQDNFSTWVRRRKGIAPGTLRRTVSHQNPLEALEQEAEPPKEEVVNAPLIGAGVRLVYESVLASAAAGRFALTCGGDHSIAAGSICALHKVYPDLGVIWIDAHADANTPRTSPSAHYHGMPAAHLLGWFDNGIDGFEWFEPGCLSENRLAYIGLRDIDAEEGRMLRASNVHVFTMREVDKHGIAKVMEMALSAIDPNGFRPLHLSLDIDAVDPHFAPGTGTAARGGLSYREIHYIAEEMAETRRLVGMDLVEINPGLDEAPQRSSMHGDDPNLKPCSPTVQLGVEVALSALGKRIM